MKNLYELIDQAGPTERCALLLTGVVLLYAMSCALDTLAAGRCQKPAKRAADDLLHFCYTAIFR